MAARGVSTATDIRSQISELVGPNAAIAPMIIPPDGGWGWVIVIVGLVSACVLDGCIYCIYLFRTPMTEDLKIEGSEITYLSSITTGFYFFGALLACSFANHFGFRLTTIIGAIVSSLSYFSGYFFQEMFYYYTVVGVGVGLAAGFLSVGTGLPASFYFDKKRSIALGIVSCGSGLGGLIMPNIMKYFMIQFGWRLTFVFEASLGVILIFLGLLIRPLKPVMVVINAFTSFTTLTPYSESIMDMSAFRVPPTDLKSSMLSSRLADTISMTRSMVAGRRVTQPTILQMAEDQDIISIRIREDTEPSTLIRLHDMIQSRRPSAILQPSASNIFNNVRISDDPLIQRRLPWYKCGCCRSKYVVLSQRPLLRTDLYYTGSLNRLPQYVDREKDLDYHMYVTKVPPFYQTLHDMTKTYTLWCCHNFVTGLGYLVDYKLFASPAFMCLAFCGFSVYIAFYLPYLFIKVHLEQAGNENYGSMLVSFYGGGCLIGRLTSGLIITQCPRFGARMVCSFMTIIASIVITLMVLSDNLYFKGLCLTIFGYTIGFYVPLRSLIVVDYFGLEKLTSGTGVIIICVGLGSCLGPIIAEGAMDYTDNKNVPFYVCGISLFLGGIALLPMAKIRKWEKKRAEKNRGLTR